jgi:hypothetical protein
MSNQVSLFRFSVGNDIYEIRLNVDKTLLSSLPPDASAEEKKRLITDIAQKHLKFSCEELAPLLAPALSDPSKMDLSKLDKSEKLVVIEEDVKSKSRDIALKALKASQTEKASKASLGSSSTPFLPELSGMDRLLDSWLKDPAIAAISSANPNDSIKDVLYAKISGLPTETLKKTKIDKILDDFSKSLNSVDDISSFTANDWLFILKLMKNCDPNLSTKDALLSLVKKLEENPNFKKNLDFLISIATDSGNNCDVTLLSEFFEKASKKEVDEYIKISTTNPTDGSVDVEKKAFYEAALIPVSLSGTYAVLLSTIKNITDIESQDREELETRFLFTIDKSSLNNLNLPLKETNQENFVTQGSLTKDFEESFFKFQSQYLRHKQDLSLSRNLAEGYKEFLTQLPVLKGALDTGTLVFPLTLDLKKLHPSFKLLPLDEAEFRHLIEDGLSDAELSNRFKALFESKYSITFEAPPLILDKSDCQQLFEDGITMKDISERFKEIYQRKKPEIISFTNLDTLTTHIKTNYDDLKATKDKSKQVFAFNRILFTLDEINEVFIGSAPPLDIDIQTALNRVFEKKYEDQLQAVIKDLKRAYPIRFKYQGKIIEPKEWRGWDEKQLQTPPNDKDTFENRIGIAGLSVDKKFAALEILHQGVQGSIFTNAMTGIISTKQKPFEYLAFGQAEPSGMFYCCEVTDDEIKVFIDSQGAIPYIDTDKGVLEYKHSDWQEYKILRSISKRTGEVKTQYSIESCAYDENDAKLIMAGIVELKNSNFTGGGFIKANFRPVVL